MDPFNDAFFANYCINILANFKKLPSNVYYYDGDNIKSMFWNNLSKREIKKIQNYFNNKEIILVL
jgi:hypothetical protein